LPSNKGSPHASAMEPVQHHHQRQCLRRAGHWQVAEEPDRCGQCQINLGFMDGWISTWMLTLITSPVLHPIGFQRREFPEVGVQAFFATNPYLSKIGFISGYSY
jgi:hypothetical protein